MTDVRYTLGVGYLVGSGGTLAVILLASAARIGTGDGAGVAIGPLLGTVPALGLASAPLWLSRVRVDGTTAWRTAMWAALGIGAVALLDVGVLLARLMGSAMSAATLAFVAYGAGFGGVCGALADVVETVVTHAGRGVGACDRPPPGPSARSVAGSNDLVLQILVPAGLGHPSQVSGQNLRRPAVVLGRLAGVVRRDEGVVERP